MPTKKILLFFACVTIFSFTVNAQKTTNIGFGISPYGGSWIKFKRGNDSDKKLKLDYTNYLGAHAFYERQLKGINFMIEAGYATANLDKFSDEGYAYNANDYEDYDDKISIISLHVYGGQTINKQKRFQIPFYYGIGINSVSGEPIDKIFLSASLKLRFKFYITNKLAVYGGGAYDTGFGSNDNGTNKSDRIAYNTYHIDSGILFNF